MLLLLPTPPLATTKPDARQLIATTKQTALNDKIAHRNGSAADERRVEAVSAVFRIILPYARVVMGDIFPSGDTFFLSTDTPDSDILLFFGYFSRNMRCINISFHNKKNNNSEHCYSLISLSLCLCVCSSSSLTLSLSLSLSLYDTHFNSSTFNKAMRTNNPFCAWRKYALLLSPSTAGSISSTLGKGCITQAVSDKASITD